MSQKEDLISNLVESLVRKVRQSVQMGESSVELVHMSELINEELQRQLLNEQDKVKRLESQVNQLTQATFNDIEFIKNLERELDQRVQRVAQTQEAVTAARETNTRIIDRHNNLLSFYM